MRNTAVLLLLFVSLAAAAFGQAAAPDAVAARAIAVQELAASVKGAAPAEAPRVFTTPDGYVRFLGAPPSGSFASRAAKRGAPEDAALAFLEKQRGLFVNDSGAIGFKAGRVKKQASYSSVRIEETYAGLPVFGAGVVVQVGAAGGIECILSDVMRNTEALDIGKVSVKPTLSAARAEAAAAAWLAAQYPDLKFQATPASLVVFDPAVVGAAGSVQLAWQTEVANTGVAQVKEVALVNAHSGDIAFHYPLIYDAKYREIYNAVGALLRREGDPPTGKVDVDLAYDYLGDTYDFYLTEHGRDSINDAGMPLIANVGLAMANAYWDGSEMSFGAGWVTDDVAAHELTHGVTDYESGLIYSYQSGAINESFSDMWGEWVDLVNGSGDDSPAVRWLMGEDLPVPYSGGIRYMADPTVFDDPDRMSSPYWYTGSGDNGGVHTNSGVGNKLCYLLTDGDTFNGYTVLAMGISSAPDLFYECQANLLTPSSDYFDLYNALTQAAINLGWSQADRDNVNAACRAVEIRPLPAGVSDFRATSSEGVPNVDLSWTNPPAPGLVSVIVRRSDVDPPTGPTDGDPVYDGLGASTTDGPLTIGNRYYYGAWAFYGGTDYSAPAYAEVVVGADQPDYFTELFSSADNDLDYMRLTLLPDGSSDFYAAFTEPAAAFPVNLVDHTPLKLSDDSFAQMNLKGGAQVSLYGVAYPSVYVGSNGYVTFGSGDTDYSDSLNDHFRLPRVSALFTDLNPAAGGKILWKQLTDRAVVSCKNVPEYGAIKGNDFQIELFFDGRIRITWLRVVALDGLAGVSAGGGIPADYQESNLNAYPAP